MPIGFLRSFHLLQSISYFPVLVLKGSLSLLDIFLFRGYKCTWIPTKFPLLDLDPNQISPVGSKGRLSLCVHEWIPRSSAFDLGKSPRLRAKDASLANVSRVHCPLDRPWLGAFRRSRYGLPPLKIGEPQRRNKDAVVLFLRTKRGFEEERRAYVASGGSQYSHHGTVGSHAFSFQRSKGGFSGYGETGPIFKRAHLWVY